ncbi:hypothetical protein E2562_010764 [Oryza meyeriana var. granulata]|uniref:Uncharacterized protein n=1 Tax=Oryza meyeriana var. granulata TaxID=110450 RepID=A0A6G1EWI1_9ORYZ|nr:hypothetical protein E2562_010759 [Oryza meyeriana var. granulata]KAF0928917.1 hypothetical protein E2562_010764 [Oryza meyeriana var. granulata]
MVVEDGLGVCKVEPGLVKGDGFSVVVAAPPSKKKRVEGVLSKNLMAEQRFPTPPELLIRRQRQRRGEAAAVATEARGGAEEAMATETRHGATAAKAQVWCVERRQQQKIRREKIGIG